ncbi:unnamed protein product [Cyclocybe aegerita]|uniref:Uncharacterized protein n=1 Tax=Cyclocybe aegerita TaxID=1973307 RepID=A0A8S0WU29_CYCAE|nr:unnamed protein product [Cyclocybe aegerita]
MSTSYPRVLVNVKAGNKAPVVQSRDLHASSLNAMITGVGRLLNAYLPEMIPSEDFTALFGSAPAHSRHHDGHELQDDRVMLAPIDEPEQYETERNSILIASATSTLMLVGESLSGDDSPPNYEPRPRDGETCLIAPVFHFWPARRPIHFADDDVLDMSDHPPTTEDAGIPGPSDPQSLGDSHSEAINISSSSPLPEGSDTVGNEPGSESSFVPPSCGETPASQPIPTVFQGPLGGCATSEDEASRTSIDEDFYLVLYCAGHSYLTAEHFSLHSGAPGDTFAPRRGYRCLISSSAMVPCTIWSFFWPISQAYSCTSLFPIILGQAPCSWGQS